MAKKFILNTGDIFSISLNDNEIGFGQVISEYNKRSGGFRIAVYDVKSLKNQSPNVAEIINAKPLFVGFTFDSKLFHKDWVIVANSVSNIENFVLPYFKLGTPPDEIYLVDYKGNRIAEISEEVFNELEYKTEIAPIRYENALKAHFGLQEWKEEDYDKILYKHTLKSNEIANKILANA